MLATKIIELQEQNRMTQAKVNEVEKRSTTIMRERDQVLLENGRIVAAKTKLESLCRELNRHNQQIRVSGFELDRICFFIVRCMHFRMTVLSGSAKMKPNVKNWLQSFRFGFFLLRSAHGSVSDVF